MKQNNVYDVAIIGGGIVGLATAMALKKTCKLSLIILEKENRLAAHQTGNNSGVIHSGLYYKPGSLKARNCVAGRNALLAFCREHAIPFDQCGKLVVATSKAEIPALEDLQKRGQENGLTGIRRLQAGELKDFEPHVTGIDGLFVPETGIIDYTRVTETYAQVVQQAGGEIMLNAHVQSFTRRDGEMILATTSGEIRCRNVVNCAGLYSDRIARMCGVDPELQIIPFRGEYYKLIPEKYALVKNLIYPVPNPEFPFLGVHFTRMIDGGVEAGPNAVLAFKREGYSKLSFSARDVWQYTFFPGFRKMAWKFWRMGIEEYYRSFSKAAFVHALQKLIPEICSKDLQKGGAGVRAQALEDSGKLVDDFRIRESEHMVHVLNAPSPAATASISIGQTIADLAAKNFNLAGL